MVGLCVIFTACISPACISPAKAKSAPDSIRQITLWTAEGKTSLVAKQAIFLRNQIEERLPGIFIVSVKTGPITPSEGKMLGHVQKGELDLVLLSDAVVDAVPKLSVFRIPWLFQNRSHVQESLYAGLEDELRHVIDKNLKVVALGVYDNVFHHMRARTTMTTPEAFKNRRVLVNSGSKTHRMFRNLGAFPQKYPFNRADEAIAKGIVDSYSGSIRQLTTLPIDKQASTLTLTHHQFDPVFFLASQKFWKSLNNAQRAVFTELAVDFSDTAHHLAMAHDEAARKAIPKGLTVKRIYPEEFEEYTDLWRKVYVKSFGADWLEYIDFAQEQTSAEGRIADW